MSVSAALQKLANHRVHNTRASQEIYSEGSTVLKSKGVRSLGDDAWTFLEQLALAAIDIGNLDVADKCLEQIAEKFPASPRVDILVGIRMEASESPATVLQYYDEILENDSANGAAWKRKITILRRLGQIDKAANELVQFLDTFYSDVEGWLELADIYSSCNQYTFALQALSHVLLLAPQNPFYTLQFAETAYTANDLPLALKMALVVIDMCEQDETQRVPEGISIRAWWTIKLCTKRLIVNNSSNSASHTPVPKHLKLIDELATERVLQTYSAAEMDKRDGKDAAGRGLVSAWMTAI